MKHKLEKTLQVFTALALMFVMSPKVLADSNVKNVTELKAAIAAATADEIIYLSNDFESETTHLTIDKNITIDGLGVVWDGGKMNLNGTGNVRMQNISFDGTNIPADQNYLLDVNKSKGDLFLSDMSFSDVKSGAIRINSQQGTNTYMDRILVENSRGRGISLGTKSDLQISNTTFRNITCYNPGYECAAIASKDYAGKSNITNTVFENNTNITPNTGTFGGGGGAITINKLSGEINISQSIFKGNATNGKDVALKDTYDGGALYLFNILASSKVNIDTSSFIENVAYDDGGAILIQTFGKQVPVENIYITNNTFYGNKAYGTDGGQFAGGAIQFFGNADGRFSKFDSLMHVYGNTFAYNAVGGHSASSNDVNGAVIGSSKNGIFASNTIEMRDNIFVGNHIIRKDGSLNYGEGTSQINFRGTGSFLDQGNNIGYMSDEANIKDILGIYPVRLSNNSSKIKAGVDNQIIPTLAFKPQGATDNSAGQIIKGNDQHLTTRYKDAGAIELSHIQFNANGGMFKPKEMTSFEGGFYYELNNNETEDFYLISKIDNTTHDIQEKVAIPEREGYNFIGWAQNPDSTNVDYMIDEAIPFIDENLIVYAVWEKVVINYTVIYEDGVSGTVFDTESYVVEEHTLTPTFSIDSPTRDGFIFTGWNPKVKETVTEDITYVAQWEKLPNKYTVIYEDGVSGTVFDTESYVVEEHVLTPSFSIDNPKRDGFIFAGWNPKVKETVTEDITYVAQWESISNKYTIQYVDGVDGSVFTAEIYTVEENSLTPEFSKTPIREGYTFIGWNPNVQETVTKNMTYVAQWNKDVNLFIVEYKDGVNGSVFNTEKYTVAENTATPNFTQENPFRDGYLFKGWSPKVKETVTEDIIYTAQWDMLPLKYTVRYIDGVDGSIFANEAYLVDENTLTPSFSLGKPTRDAYVFTGWSPEVEEFVTKDIEYVAQWKKVESQEPSKPITPSKPLEPSKPVVPQEPVAPIQPDTPVLPTTGQFPLELLAGGLLLAGIMMAYASKRKRIKE